MINVRTQGKHEGHCEDLDAKSPLRSVEAVRSEATPGLLAQKKEASRPLSPDRNSSLFISRVVKIDICCTCTSRSLFDFPAQDISDFSIERQTFRIRQCCRVDTR